MILSCKNISLSFGAQQILKNITFQLNPGEKTALVGINGAGKSTLFKTITKQLQQDSGEVILKSNTSLAYLSQNTLLDSNKTIYKELITARPDILEMESQINALHQEMSTIDPTSQRFETLTRECTLLTTKYEYEDGYSYKSRIKGILTGLSFTVEDYDRPVNTLSGGQKTRLALAKLLVKSPDILLLDEPTNHLDIRSTEWLEGFLSNYKNTLIIISHDRYFLDKVVSKVIEIENGLSKVYTGNYSSFIKTKEQDTIVAEKHYENQQKEIARQEEIIKKLKSFNREKSIKRAESREKNLNKIDRLDKPISLNDKMKLSLTPQITSGNDVLHIENLEKAFDDNQLFKNVNIDIQRGERVALIGGNGTGKSTLFRILTEQVPADTGEFKLGSKVHIGYYDQEHATIHSDLSLFDEISYAFPNLTDTEIRNTLAAFLFTGDDVFNPISTLSGGEKGRLTLAKLMLSKANFLLLDEPTNHLDVMSKEILEDVLIHYTGTVFFISHDRYFINQVAKRVLDLSQKGITNYIGNYDYYLEKRDEQLSNSATATDNKPKAHKEIWLQNKEREKEAKKKEKAITAIEAEIHNLEISIEEIEEALCNEAIYLDYEKCQELENKKSTINENLEELYTKWELLTS